MKKEARYEKLLQFCEDMLSWWWEEVDRKMETAWEKTSIEEFKEWLTEHSDTSPQR